jgi:hypothetical protein
MLFLKQWPTWDAANVPTSVDYIGSIWSGTGYEQQYPRILRYPREYVVSTTYVNVVYTAVIV